MKDRIKDRTASIKETGEELSQDQWARFEAAVEGDDKAARSHTAAPAAPCPVRPKTSSPARKP
jgi:hypothetical protein